MNPVTLRYLQIALLSPTLLVLPSCTSTGPQPKAERAEAAAYQPGVPGGKAVETTTVTARIVSVIPNTRELTLDLPDGTRETVKCGPEVVNFDQLRKDDTVKITLTQEVAVAMAKESDAPGATGDGIVSLAPKGGTPGGVMAATTQVTATVIAIDLGHHTAVLQFPDGQTRTVAVRHDVDLSKRKVGEKVNIRMTTAMALRVDKPQQP
jgi:hypothetical protein